MARSALIRTPDQRVRVFVSSTTGELAAEREVVRKAVERLRLRPVMLEGGVRPDPPREFYRAYLAQSHVFIGIYWQQYGWVPPGQAISGLEDEFRLAGSRPRLLYLKEPAPARDERLHALIKDFKADGTASYKRFGTVDELARLVSDDLALLLAERFKTTIGAAPARPVSAPPQPVTPTEGRGGEIAGIVRRFHAGERLVTVTGPDGVGKTRVALETAHVLRDEFAGGVHFVGLGAVREPWSALRTIADALAVRTEGVRPISEALAEHFQPHPHLLVLDQLEQVPGLGTELASLLAQAPELRLLATSRQVLRVPGEREMPLRPLPPPGSARLADAKLEPSVKLFVNRATMVAPTFRLTSDNVAAVVELCRRLDGLPLAIELVAAHTRQLPPARLLAQLSRGAGGPGPTEAGLPDRPRALSATLDWSYQLLSGDEQAIFRWLSVFSAGFTLEAAETVGRSAGLPQVLGPVASLLDRHLLLLDDVGGAQPRLRMLAPVRAYAAEQLAKQGETARLRAAHLAYLRRLADHARPHLCGPGQREWSERLDAERANIRAAVATALESGDDEVVIELAWDSFGYYWIKEAVAEPESWLAAVSAAGRPLGEVHTAKLDCLAALTQISRGDGADVRERLTSALAVFRAHQMDFEAAVALNGLANIAYLVDNDWEQAAIALRESSRRFASVHHDWGRALAETMLGTVLAVGGDHQQAEHHHRCSLELAGRIGHEPILVQALHQRALARVLAGQSQEAVALLHQAAPLVRRSGLRGAAAHCLVVVAAIAVDRADLATAAEALAMAAQIRRRLGTPLSPPVRGLVNELTGRVRAGLGGVQVALQGRERDPFAALERGLAAIT